MQCLEVLESAQILPRGSSESRTQAGPDSHLTRVSWVPGTWAEGTRVWPGKPPSSNDPPTRHPRQDTGIRAFSRSSPFHRCTPERNNARDYASPPPLVYLFSSSNTIDCLNLFPAVLISTSPFAHSPKTSTSIATSF